jgi:hypothetical protein
VIETEDNCPAVCSFDVRCSTRGPVSTYRSIISQSQFEDGYDLQFYCANNRQIANAGLGETLICFYGLRDL